jgi:WD40 repeat protein
MCARLQATIPDEVPMSSYPRLLAFVVLPLLAAPLAAEPARDRFGDPLPEGAIARLGSLRLRHGSSVRVGDFSADSKLVAAFSGGFIIFWDATSGREARRVPAGHLVEPRCFRLSPDGKALILADRWGEFRIIDAVTGAERLKVEPQKLDRRYLDVHALSVSRDGKTAVTLYHGDYLVVWDLVGGKRLREFTLRNNLNRFSNKPIALTPDGKHVVVPHADGSLHLLDVTSGEEVLAFEMPSDRPRNAPPRVTISSDGRYLAYGGSSTNASSDPCKSVTLCDMTTGKRFRELSLKDSISEWVFTPDSRALAVSDAHTVRLFDVSSGKETKAHRKPKGWGIVFSPDGRKLAVSFGTCISLLDVETGQLLHSPVGHDWFIRTIQFSPDGKRLVSNTSGDIIVWDVATSRAINIYPSGQLQQWISATADGEAIRFLDWKLLDWQLKPSPRRKDKGLNERGLESGEEKRPSGTERRTIYRWDLATDRKEQHTAFSIPAACDWFVLSPDGQRVASVTLSAEPKVSLSDVKDGKPEVAAALPDNSRVVEVRFSPDSRRLLLRSWYGALRILDSATGQPVLDLSSGTPRRSIALGAFAADGRSVVLMDEGRLCIRELASGKDRLQIPLTRNPYEGSSVLALSPDGRFLARSFFNGKDGSILVFSTATGKQLAHWSAELGTSQAVAISPDSRLLATGGYDGTMLLWKLPENDGLPATLPQEEAAAFWRALADFDAALANRALAGLAAAPAQAVPLIKERFRTEWKKLSAEQVARWIAELDNDSFKVRERAASGLAEAGADVVAELREALANNPTVEAKKRLEDLVNRLSNGGSPERLRSLRAIEVLERIGTAQAKELLRELSRKSLPADLDDEIQASLRRLGERR